MVERAMILSVNGTETTVSADPDTALLYVLRETLGLRGTRYGCGEEACGACMVLLDGQPAFSCTTPAGDVGSRSIETVEALGTEAEPGRLQQAFLDLQAGQCGYCLSGILVSATALLRRNPAPDRAAVLAALEPHLCRCGVQNRIVAAVLQAAAP